MRANGAGPDRAVTGNGGGTAPIARCRARSSSIAKVKALDRPEVKKFVDFYLDKGAGPGARSRLHSAARQGTGAGADAVRGAQDRHDVHRHGQPQPGDPGTASHSIDHGADVAARERAAEFVIERALFLCAAGSILVTVGIILVLLWETAAFLREVPLTQFPVRDRLDTAVFRQAVRRPAAGQRDAPGLGDRHGGCPSGRPSDRRLPQ